LKIEGQNRFETGQINFPLKGTAPMFVSFSPKAQLIHDHEEDIFVALTKQKYNNLCTLFNTPFIKLGKNSVSLSLTIHLTDVFIFSILTVP